MQETTVEISTRTLVLGMIRDDGAVLASEVYPVAAACGQTPDQVRSCLRRLVGEGLFVRQGAGANARFEATPEGLAFLGSSMERARLAYAQDSAGTGWDRLWRLVAFAIPEGRRAARDALRDHLVSLGGAAIQGGLYVSPHPWLKDVNDEADRLGVSALVACAVTDDLVVGGERDPREIVGHLWPLDELGTDYKEFVSRFSPVRDALVEMSRRHELLSDATFLPGALSMAVAFQDCFSRDPLLPPELLPRPWPGRAARDLVIESRRLALGLREKQRRPLLFHMFDQALEVIP